MPNYLDLCKRLQQRTGTGGADMTSVSGHTGALRRLTQYVDEAWTQIQVARRDWSFRWGQFSETLTAGSSVYDMDSEIGSGVIQTLRPDILTIETAADPTTRQRLVLMDYSYFEDNFGDKVAQSGRPLYCAFQPGNRKVEFNTILDVDYILKGRYIKAKQTLASDSDTPIMDEQYHDAIFYLALMKWAEFEEADQIYATARASYDQWMTTMVNDLTPKLLVGEGPLA